MMISLTVILIESTNEIEYGLPILLTVTVRHKKKKKKKKKKKLKVLQHAQMYLIDSLFNLSFCKSDKIIHFAAFSFCSVFILQRFHFWLYYKIFLSVRFMNYFNVKIGKENAYAALHKMLLFVFVLLLVCLFI